MEIGASLAVSTAVPLGHRGHRSACRVFYRICLLKCETAFESNIRSTLEKTWRLDSIHLLVLQPTAQHVSSQRMPSKAAGGPAVPRRRWLFAVRVSRY